MTTLAENSLIPILIALAIGLVIGWWAFRHARRTRPGDRIETTRPAERASAPPPPTATAAPADRQDLADDYAAAGKDVAGEFLGVEAHPIAAGPAGPPDNLQTLKGVGPKLAAQLNAIGLTRFDQLAQLTPNEVEIIDRRMGAFRGRIARDRLVEQAAYLARGDIDGFEEKFGKLGG